MGRRRVSLVFGVWLLLLVSMFTLAYTIQLAKAGGPIYIRADGSVEPKTAPISTVDNVTYTFTDNIYDSIVVERDDVVVDGASYTVQGSGNGTGIDLNHRYNVTVKNTRIIGFEIGISLGSLSSGNTLTNNNVTKNESGIYLIESSSNVLKNNSMVGNSYNFGVWGYDFSHFIHDVDSSNTVDGKPVCYWVNQQNMEVPSNAGYVALVNSFNIKVEGLELKNDGQGVLLAYTSDSRIAFNDITNNGYGVYLIYSYFNNIYHNNFINNSEQVHFDGFKYGNVWDAGYPFGGNYWSDYKGTDFYSGPYQNEIGSDGIGDTPYVIDADNQDKYPLMKPLGAPPTPAEAYISVPYHYQVTTYYCGPACLEMVFDYYGPDIEQVPIAEVAETISPYGTWTYGMVRAAHFSNLSTSVGTEMPGNITGYIARKLGYAAFEYWGMTINELKSLIAAGYPIIVMIPGHYRVAVGYNSTHITFQDPLRIRGMIKMTYEAFDLEWDYAGRWGLLISPWKVEVSVPTNVWLGSVFNVTARITYPLPLPFPAIEYPASVANAKITLPAGLTPVSGETTKKILGTGDLFAGASANLTWTVRADSPGTYTISVEAEGEVTGFVPSDPFHPEFYFYVDRIGGIGHSVAVVSTTVDDYDGLWHTKDFTITLKAHDMSKIAETYYKINNESIKTVRADGQPLITTEGADNTLEYWSVDKAGHVEEHHILTGIKLDKTAPTGSININKDASYTNSTSVTLTLTAADDTSGIYQVRYSNDGVWDNEPWETPSTTKTWTLTSVDGTKTVYYQIKDNAGLNSTYSNTIVLDRIQPTAKAGVDKTINEDTPVTLDASASKDMNGIANYTWTFTDVTPQALTGKNPTYNFTTPGTYIITLKVTDPAGNTATDTVTITVLDITEPEANAGSNRTVDEDTSITLDGSDSFDNVDITDYTWTFTDVTTQTLTGPKPTYTFNTPGVYTITLTVIDAAGNWAEDTIVITVLDITKPAANAGQNQTANVGTAVNFDAGASTDNVGVISYLWDFGDGTTETGKTTTHTYMNPGTYTVILTVKDAAGNTAYHSINVTVLPAEAPPSLPAEAFPMWIIGAAIAAIAIAAAALLLRKRK